MRLVLFSYSVAPSVGSTFKFWVGSLEQQAYLFLVSYDSITQLLMICQLHIQAYF